MTNEHFSGKQSASDARFQWTRSTTFAALGIGFLGVIAAAASCSTHHDEQAATTTSPLAAIGTAFVTMPGVIPPGTEGGSPPGADRVTRNTSTALVGPVACSTNCSLRDGLRCPIANKKYHLVHGTVRGHGSTDTDGILTANIPKDLAGCEIIVWLDEYPEGARAHYVFELGKLPDIETLDGLRARPHALGYDVGLGRTNIDETTTEAIEHFRRDHRHDGLKMTGKFDDETRAALEKVFGGQGVVAASNGDSTEGSHEQVQT